MKKSNIFKVAALTAVFAVAGMFANAQETTTDIPKKPNTPLGGVGGSVKVIDNKGTIKYIQTQNGITTFTNLAPDGGIVTTWQLGGTLSDSTYIDVNGKQFGIKGLDTVGTGSYQLIVVDPANGQFRRLAFEGLIQSGRQKFEIGATYPVPAGSYTLTLSPVVVLPNFSQVYVYRNGAKLLATEDYVVSGTGAFLIQSANVTLYPNDVIEVHYIK